MKQRIPILTANLKTIDVENSTEANFINGNQINKNDLINVPKLINGLEMHQNQIKFL